MKKRFLSIITAAVTASCLLMSGCGSSASTSTSSAASTEASKVASTAESAAASTVSAAVSTAASTASGDSASTFSMADPTDEELNAKVTIGISWMDLTTEYQANLQKLINVEVAKNYPNVKLIHMDGGSDASNQCSQVENLIAQGVDAILMVPYDRNGCMPAVEAAADAKIPLIELCQETDSPERTSFVGSLHYDSGKMLMEALMKKVGGKGKIVYLEGPIGQDSALARTQAANDVLKNYPDAQMVAEKVCDWDRAAAMSAVENIIQSGMSFDVIYAESDSMALGAMEALSGTDLEGKVVVGGIDMLSDALASIEAGGMYCTCFQNSPEQAKVGIQVAVDAALGKTVESQYIIPFELVTAENAANYEHAMDALKS